MDIDGGAIVPQRCLPHLVKYITVELYAVLSLTGKMVLHIASLCSMLFIVSCCKHAAYAVFVHCFAYLILFAMRTIYYRAYELLDSLYNVKTMVVWRISRHTIATFDIYLIHWLSLSLSLPHFIARMYRILHFKQIMCTQKLSPISQFTVQREHLKCGTVCAIV